MTALPRRMYRNPEEQLLEAEAEGCKGCIHREVSGTKAYCSNPNTRTLLAEVRCDKYEDAK